MLYIQCKNSYVFIPLLLCIANFLYAQKRILSLQPSKTDTYYLDPAFLQGLAFLSQAENFVETGTYFGDTTNVAARIFEHVYSIELSASLYFKAKERFKKYKNIDLLLGNSETVLPLFLNELNGKTIIFLDGHYSDGITAKGEIETPIIGELIAIKNSTLDKPIIIIDDIRFFTRHLESDYPSLALIEQMVKTLS